MIDLKLLREDPDAVRAFADGPAARTRRSSMRCWTPTPPGAPPSRPPTTLRAEQKAVSKQVGRGRARRAARRCWRRPRSWPSGSRTPRPSRPPPKRRSPRPTWRSPTSSSTVCPPAARTTSSCWTPSANPPSIDNPKDHLELGESLGLIDMERGAKVSGLAVLLPDRPRRTAATRAVATRGAGGDGERLHADDPAGAGAARDDGGHRLPRRARRRGVPDRGRRPVPGRHLGGAAGGLPLRRDPRPVRRARCGTPDGRRASAARRAATARTPAASSACTSSTRSRASSTAGPRTPRPSTSGCWGGSARCSPTSRCPTA